MYWRICSTPTACGIKPLLHVPAQQVRNTRACLLDMGARRAHQQRPHSLPLMRLIYAHFRRAQNAQPRAIYRRYSTAQAKECQKRAATHQRQEKVILGGVLFPPGQLRVQGMRPALVLQRANRLDLRLGDVTSRQEARRDCSGDITHLACHLFKYGGDFR